MWIYRHTRVSYPRTMGRYLVGGALLVCACHAKLDDLPSEQASPDGGIVTTQDDAPPAVDAFVLPPWPSPAKVTGASANGIEEDDGTLSSTTLELVFAVATANGKDLYHATRTSPTSAWSTPQRLGFNVTDASDETPRFADGDLTLYFASGRAGGAGDLDIYRVTRPAIGGAWSAPQNVAGPNSAAAEKWFAICEGNRYLVIRGADIFEGTLGGGAPTVNATLSLPAAAETGSFLSEDCLTAYYSTVTNNVRRIFTSTRPTAGGAWATPTQVTDFAALGGDQEDPWISGDGRTFLLTSNVGGTKDVYIVTR